MPVSIGISHAAAGRLCDLLLRQSVGQSGLVLSPDNDLSCHQRTKLTHESSAINLAVIRAGFCDIIYQY